MKRKIIGWALVSPALLICIVGLVYGAIHHPISVLCALGALIVYAMAIVGSEVLRR